MIITTKRMFSALIALGMLGLGSVFAGTTTNSTLSLTEGFESYDLNSAITNWGAWFSGANDQSVVTNSPDGYPASYTAPCGLPLPTSAHTKVLALNTQGDTLSNVFNNVDMSGSQVYLDTMVQFVPGEIPNVCTTATDAGIKLAVFAYAGDTTTNLMIYAGCIDYSTRGAWLSNQVVDTGIAISSNDWHRLTVKYDATTQIPLGHDNAQVDMFEVLLDGQAITNGNGYNDDWQVQWTNDILPSLSETGKWFRAATIISPKNLNAVAFQGTGLIDDLAVTTTSPLSSPTFTITQIGLNGTVTASDPNTSITVAANGTTSIVYTAADWYRISSVTQNGSSIFSGSTNTYTVTFANVMANGTATVSAVQGTAADLSLPAGVDVNWVRNYYTSLSDAQGDGNLALDYLLGQPATNAYTEALSVKSLTVTDSTNVSVVVSLSGPGVTLPATINGTLKLQGSTNLTSWADVGSAAINNATFDGTGDSAAINFTDTSASQFYKAMIVP